MGNGGGVSEGEGRGEGGAPFCTPVIWPWHDAVVALLAPPRPFNSTPARARSLREISVVSLSLSSLLPARAPSDDSTSCSAI